MGSDLKEGLLPPGIRDMLEGKDGRWLWTEQRAVSALLFRDGSA